MALPVLTPPKVVTPTYRRTRENGTAQDGRSFNPLLLFLVTARPLVSLHRSPGVAAPSGRHPVTLSVHTAIIVRGERELWFPPYSL